MNDKQLILDALEDPKVLEKAFSRRDALRGGSAWGAGLALASMPVAMATLVKRALAQENGGAALPDTIVNVLNFALLLEYLEADFYNQGLAADGLIPMEDRPVFQMIAINENSHVAFLRAVLGDSATPEPVFDYTAGGRFDPFGDYSDFTLIAQTFEDTGTSAYKGQAPALYEAGNALILTAALRIHSVEARHVAAIRTIRGLQGWIPFDQPDAPEFQQATYANEANTVHAGIDATTVTMESRQAVTEAFDEPLGLREVLAIVSPFGTNTLKTGTTFMVRVENVSEPGTLSVDRLNGVVPLSPGAFAIFSGANPMFTAGEMADQGTELIAEDGFPSPQFSPPDVRNQTKVAMLKNADNVSAVGAFAALGGPGNSPAILPGERSEFVINANPGERLQIQTMFVQSNDWFYGFGGDGLTLFDGDDPISGDVTSQLVLYDAGTEEDTPPGTGPFQKPVQDPLATDVGPAESVPIQRAEERHPDFMIPAASAVIRVTITPR